MPRRNRNTSMGFGGMRNSYNCQNQRRNRRRNNCLNYSYAFENCIDNRSADRKWLLDKRNFLEEKIDKIDEYLKNW